MKKSSFAVLLAIILLGGFFRFWKLSDSPVSLSIDEVAIGYNTYSILKTGRDEWGEFLPLAFRSIGDYKPPLLEYLMLPAIGIFGLTEFGTRFTVALVSTLTLFFVFLLLKEITKNQAIALLATFSLAVSPWHVQFSRMTHEAVVALFLVIVGVWLFIKSLSGKKKLYWLSAIFLALSLYTYHTERLFTPLFVLGLAIIFSREILRKENRKGVLVAAGVGLVLSLAFLKIMFSSKGSTRATNAFIDRDVELNYQLHKNYEKLSPFQKILDTNQLMIFNFWTKRYLNYFDLPYLFFNGMKLSMPRAPQVGLLHLFELPFFLIGIWKLFVKKRFLGSENIYRFIVFWFLLSPLAASVANNEQHPARSLVFIPIPHLIVGVGFYVVWEKIKLVSNLKRIAALSIIGVVVVASLIYYLDIYHFHYPISFSEYCSYGMKEVALYVWSRQKDYKKIVIDSTFGTDGPYTTGTPQLYIYFYGRYDPSLLQKDPLHGKGPDKDSSDFLNFSFRPIYWPKDRGAKETLFVGSPWSLPKEDLKGYQILKTIPFKNGATGFVIVESQ